MSAAAVLFCFVAPSASNAAAHKSGLAEKVATILSKNGVNKEQVGLFVSDEDGKEIIDINGDKQFVPASITKIIPAAASLTTWEQNFQFRTQLYVDSDVKDKTLKGSLYLKGGGDPSLISERLWVLVNMLTREDITSIDGDLVIDESRFDSIRFDEGRDPPVEGRAFDAPVGALSFNWNSVNIFVRPGSASGQPAIVKIDPPNEYIQGVENTAKTSAGGETSIAATRIPVKKDGQIIGDKVLVSGKIPLKGKEIVIYRSISEPDLWTGNCFLQFLKQRNITVKGQIKRGVTPNSARLLVDSPGAPIGDMVKDMMKWSNNYLAEMLTKNLAAEGGEKPATILTGVEQLKKFLDGLKIPRSQYSITSPSGLSRRNKFPPKVLWKVLFETKKNFSVFPEFIAALPVAGIDGTLKNHMREPPARRWVRAKTGLLDGVGSLAGFIGKGSGMLTFVFMYNGPKEGIKDVYDKIIYALLD